MPSTSWWAGVPPGREDKLLPCPGKDARRWWGLLAGNIPELSGHNPVSWSFQQSPVLMWAWWHHQKWFSGCKPGWCTQTTAASALPSPRTNSVSSFLSFPSPLKTLKKAISWPQGFSIKMLYFYCWNFYCILCYKSLNPYSWAFHNSSISALFVVFFLKMPFFFFREKFCPFCFSVSPISVQQ